MAALYTRTSFRLLAIALFLIGLPTIGLVGCQSKLLYYPRDYPVGTTDRWKDEMADRGKVIAYQTSQGEQRAFLQGNLENPKHLWIACGGNATVALDWSDWVNENSDPNDAWLLFDMPGYGDCDGNPSPKRIKESIAAVMPAAFSELGWGTKVDSSKLRFFGHSLGAAVVLIAAEDYQMPKGVLLCPFTSTMEMAKLVVGLPVGFLVTHRYDNVERLDQIASYDNSEIVIYHGLGDRVIPSDMSKALKARNPSMVELHEVPQTGHNDLHIQAKEHISETIKQLSK